MLAQVTQPHLTPEEYLALEEQSEIKHEYIDGQIYAMSGTTDRHNTISGNLFILLRSHLRNSGCQTYFADIKVQLEETNCFYYPDLFVTCDPQDKASPIVKRSPKIIIEVLSNSTESFDRGDKFNDYQTLPSLEEYVLINTKHQRIETFRRGRNGLWILQTPDAAGQGLFELKSVGLTEQIAAIYETDV
jgi:Uma2 family endonuclease